jgi:hypothetical protein
MDTRNRLASNTNEDIADDRKRLSNNSNEHAVSDD